MGKRTNRSPDVATNDTSNTDNSSSDATSYVPQPQLARVTNANGFNQGLQYAKLAAANATDLASLQQFLSDVCDDSQALVQAINTAESRVQARVQAGVPPPQRLPPPPPPAPPPAPPPPDENNAVQGDGDKQ